MKSKDTLIILKRAVTALLLLTALLWLVMPQATSVSLAELDGGLNYPEGIYDAAHSSTPKFLALPFKDVAVNIVAGCLRSNGAYHGGIDYVLARGTPVLAAADGIAMGSCQSPCSGSPDVYGNFVLIKHGEGYSTLYAHLDSIAGGITWYPPEQKWNQDFGSWTSISRGEVIGYVGDAGVTPFHLHFETANNPVGDYTGHVNNRVDAYHIYQGPAYYPPTGSSYTGCGSNYLWTTCPPSYPGGPTCPTLSRLKTQTRGLNFTGFFGLFGWYNFAVEGEGRIRVSVDDELIIDTCPEGDRRPNISANRISLKPGCHEVKLEYEEAYGAPKLGISRWPEPPHFERELPLCEVAPPEKPANVPEEVVRAFFQAMDRLDVDTAVNEAIAPVPGFRQLAQFALDLYKAVMEALKLDNDFSGLRYEVIYNDGRTAKVRAYGTVIIRNTEDGSTVSETEDFDLEVPVSNFLIRWYIYINLRGLLPQSSD